MKVSHNKLTGHIQPANPNQKLGWTGHIYVADVKDVDPSKLSLTTVIFKTEKSPLGELFGATTYRQDPMDYGPGKIITIFEGDKNLEAYE